MAEIAILELEEFALELAHTAGGIAQAHFRQPITVENKSSTAFDPVTNARPSRNRCQNGTPPRLVSLVLNCVLLSTRSVGSSCFNHRAS